MGTHFLLALKPRKVFDNLSFILSLFHNSKMDNLSKSLKKMEKLRKFKKVFDFVDKDNDFEISSSDLSKTMKQLFGLRLLDEEVDDLMARFPHGRRSTIRFKEVAKVLEEKITESLNEQEINLAYEICINLCEKASSDEMRLRNEDKLERKLSLKDLKKSLKPKIKRSRCQDRRQMNREDEKISEYELLSAASMLPKSSVNDKMSKSEFSEMVSEIFKNPFISFFVILLGLNKCCKCILNMIHLFFKLTTILNPYDVEYTIDP